MIDESRTLEIYGYTSDDLTYGSNKPVVAVCENCGKYRQQPFRRCFDLCHSCSHVSHSDETCAKMSKTHTGMHHSEETKTKISKSHKGKKFSEEHKKNISKANIGRLHSDETKRKMSKATKGRRLSDETKRKLGETKRGENNPNWNGGRIEKVCKQCGEIYDVGNSRSDDSYFCSILCRGKYYSGKNNRLYGKHHIDETRRRISATKQGIPYDEWESYAKEYLYCPKFNETCRESNREKYGRRCFICGLLESENFDINGKQRKLSVHHCDMDKQQGCGGIRWKLVPVCMKHHNHSELWGARIGYLLNHIWK